MNQKQRDYLIKEISGNVNSQIRKLEEMRRQVSKVELNGYLTAAVLSGKIVYRSLEDIAAAAERRVNRGLPIVLESDRYYGDREKHELRLPAEDLFVLPKDYVDALAEAEEKKQNINRAIDGLRQYLATMKTRIMLGTDESLNHLIDEATSLGNITLSEAVIGTLPKLADGSTTAAAVRLLGAGESDDED